HPAVGGRGRLADRLEDPPRLAGGLREVIPADHVVGGAEDLQDGVREDGADEIPLRGLERGEVLESEPEGDAALPGLPDGGLQVRAAAEGLLRLVVED